MGNIHVTHTHICTHVCKGNDEHGKVVGTQRPQRSSVENRRWCGHHIKEPALSGGSDRGACVCKSLILHLLFWGLLEGKMGGGEEGGEWIFMHLNPTIHKMD